MGFLDEAKKLANQGAEKAKQVAQIAKLNVEITTLNSKIEIAKQAIGNLVVDKNISTGDSEVEAEIEKINGFNEEIAEKKNMISELETKS